METLERILAAHPFFSGMEERYIQLLVGCASNVRFDAGQYIFRAEEEANLFYLIRQGKVALEAFGPERGPIVILTLEQGDVLGWSWLIPPHRYKFDARVVEFTRAIALDGTCLRKKSEENHDLGYEFMKRFSQLMARALQATRLQLLNVYELNP
ncbi:MAG: cyclic nucleotide-binding domain-containing protein [Acidobacteria bacterium]|nr:cyclic nucleotide-binding domain-containing protein [Acidobacteriota bacterium]